MNQDKIGFDSGRTKSLAARGFEAFLFFSLAALAYGQTASRITGMVRDPSGAAVPGVAVTATEVNRGTKQTTVTNDVGRYSFPNLAVGDYVVGAEMSGFKKATTAPIKIDVNQAVEVNITLEIGALTEYVEVTGAAPLLQTSDSQVGGLVENKEIVSLPLAARDFMQLALVVAGVVESTDNSRHQTERATWIGSFSVHGISADYNQYLFDGIAGKEMAHETNIFAPSIDAIQEMKIETSNYNAEFGSEAGGHINIVTKSGTNKLHGTLFEFLRNDALDAREKFADRKSQLNRNTFGATVGGPFRRDKTFWFAAWESMRLRQGFTQNTTVPTPAFREGDFSSLLSTDSSNPSPIVLYDWTTRQPFPNNIIPKSRMHPLSVRHLNEFVPLPNRPGLGGRRPLNNYQSLEPQKTRTDQVMGRVDHVFNSNNRVFGRYAISKTDTLGPPVWPTFSYSHVLTGQHAVLNWSRTLNATSIFEWQMGYSRFKQTELTESAFKRDVAAEFGLKGTCRSSACWHAPFFTVTDFSTMGNPSGRTLGQGVSGPRGWRNEIFVINPRLFLTRGSHTIKMGFTGNRHRDSFPQARRPVGEHNFNGQWTRGPGSNGFALADMLLGLPRRIQAEIDIRDQTFLNSHVMPWIQDDWKVTSKLTLNLGLRYEFQGRPVSNRDAMSNMYQTGSATAVIITPNGPPPGFGPPFVKRPAGQLNRSLLMNDTNNFAPRVGFAYHATRDSVVRGAYGVFYQRDSAVTWNGLASNAPFIRTGDVTLAVSEQDIGSFPVDDLTPVVNFVAPGSRPFIRALNIDWHDVYVQQWNLFLERGLRRDFVVKAGYVGNHAVGLQRVVPFNSPRPGAGSVQSRRPFQDIGNVDMSRNDGHSSYHGLELQAEKRYSRGLSFITAYTWSKTIDNTTILDWWFGSNNRGLSPLHVGHRFSFAGVWEVPYGRGKTFGSDLPAAVNAILGGWQLGGILVFRTGFPLFATTTGNIANTDGITQVPDRTREPNLPKSQRTEGRFFDTGAFRRPAAFTLGNAGARPIDGPGHRNVDVSVTKLFPLGDGGSLQFRAEFFNATNHPNMGNPGTTFGAASFGRVTSTFGEPRVIQFGLKLLF